MPCVQQWLFSDSVSGETITAESSDIPTNWGVVAGDYHGPLGLYIISQRAITQVIPDNNYTYTEIACTAYDASSAMDSGYTLPTDLQSRLTDRNF